MQSCRATYSWSFYNEWLQSGYARKWRRSRLGLHAVLSDGAPMTAALPHVRRGETHIGDDVLQNREAPFWKS